MEKNKVANWHKRFLSLAELVSTWSKDPSRKFGAVIVRPDKTVASMGFNGFPKGCIDDERIYQNRDLKLSRVVHAELNAILHARERLEGYTMYVAPSASIAPTCDRCAAHVIQAGIKTVVFEDSPIDDFAERWGDKLGRALDMYREADVQIIKL